MSAFLNGTGATLIVNLHLNGRLPEDKVPHSLEDVCTLLTNWVGSIYESDAEKRPVASIMTSSEAESETIYAYSTDSQVPSGRAKRNDWKPRVFESVEDRAKSNRDALARGVIVPPKASWTANPSAPVPPLVRTANPTRSGGDSPCENCRGYHPDMRSKKPTAWFHCPLPWDAVCVEKHAAYHARLAVRAGKAASGARAATIAVAQQAAPAVAPAAAPPPAPATTQYSAAEHAAAMAVRAATAGQPHYQSYHTYRPPPSQWVQYNAPPVRCNTDMQGWTAPWEGQIDHHSFMIRTTATAAPQAQTSDDPRPTRHLEERRRGSLVPAETPPRVRDGTQRSSELSRRRGEVDPTMMCLDDLAAWANCGSTIRRIERIVKLTGDATEAAGIAAEWYLNHESDASYLGPRARISRLRELMLADTSRAGCMLAWLRKLRVQEELVEATAQMYPTTGGRTTGSRWPPTPEHRELCRWRVEQSNQREARLNGGSCPWTAPFGGKHSPWTMEHNRAPTGPAGDKSARTNGDFTTVDTPATARICAMLTDISMRRGVPGVAYQPLPRKSMYLDPGHVLTPDCDEPVWMADSGAGAPGFNHPYGLGPITDLDRPIVIGGIVSAANVTVTKGAMLDNVQVLFDPSFGANCLATSTIVDAGWEVTYHKPTDSYVVTTASKRRLSFQRYVMANGAVTTHYLCHPRLPYSGPSPRDVAIYAALTRPGMAGSNDTATYATSVQGNMTMHSVQDVKAAAQAMRYLTNMGGSVAHGIARLPELRGVNITADHVRKAVDIYGPVRSHVQGSATSVQDVAVTTELPSVRPSAVPQSLAIDLCKILGAWFVVGVFLPSHYLTATHVHDHTGPAIIAAVKTMVQGAQKRNFDVMQIQADGERGIHSQQMDEFCAANKIRLLRVGAGQHEAHAEKYTRTLKSEVRAIAARVIPASLPSNLLVHMIVAAVTVINGLLTSALTGNRSPHQIWTGDAQIHAQDWDFGYGDLALAKTPNQQNDVAPRADTVMVLYPVYNGLHGFAVYKFGTEAVVIRNHNTLRHVPWNDSDIRHIERLGDRDPSGVDLPRREQGTDHGADAPGQQPDAAPVAAAQLQQQPAPRDHGVHTDGELGVPEVATTAIRTDLPEAATQINHDAPATEAPTMRGNRRGVGAPTLMEHMAPAPPLSRAEATIHRISVATGYERPAGRD